MEAFAKTSALFLHLCIFLFIRSLSFSESDVADEEGEEEVEAEESEVHPSNKSFFCVLAGPVASE